MLPDTLRLRLSALLGVTAIILGSLGAHGSVHDALVTAGTFENWKTAVSYHLPHAIFLSILALFGTMGGKTASWAWRSLFTGVLLFSGSLYLHSYTQVKWLVYITPVGGLAMMLGWTLLIFARWQRP
ncbi:uncharacterized membrane protein YgdD (TMEM256/DUF423 family) [Prosthecobacter fusiformis]|uniref:Uncharacterized membrane protein YgdD (TMEM256/DUF423 family) n=1 Tax=Prosthecobacter fusiformis TaxID=48464 RepID=A0A4R7SPL3_9BACT|nr:DUF423 domain-containing protein [Prosthecobacter fusiformis]TDU81152.1 uncharacterized membrane protein YgdD (TMEM256/DUF423 family) [Prosthecobacter fusiformis]